MWQTLGEIAIGFVAGIASGLFGIGGGMVTIPMLRILLGVPALVAAATPLVAIVPTALSGGYTHYRAGNVDMRTALIVGLSGALTAVAAARFTTVAGGRSVMMTLAVVIVISAINMLRKVIVSRRDVVTAGDADDAEACDTPKIHRPLDWPKAVLVGLLVGAASGFLGIGGGFIMVPLFVWLMGCSIHLAIGTSLAAIVLISTPALITHATLGHIDWRLAVILAAASAVGGVVGARLAVGSREDTLRMWFALVMIVTAASLVATEFGWI